MADEFIIIAHRGASGDWPENTLLAFQKALAGGAQWLELDVHLSADEKLVVIHDESLERTTNGSGQVARQTFAQLRQLDAGLGEKIPLLEEVLDLAAGRAKINIELKGLGTAKPVVDLLGKYFADGRLQETEILASSLNEKELRKLSGLLPQVPRALVAEDMRQEVWELTTALDCWSLHQDKDCIDQHLVAEARARNIRLLAYTVNERQEFQRLRDLGIDGVFTDYPEQLSSKNE
jgi:glycerophosphoryl diester phosphodiesterase